MANIVYANGSKTVTVAASDKISVTSLSPYAVYKMVGYPNLPSQKVLLDNVDSAPYNYTSAAFSAETDVIIEAGPSDCVYATGTGANAARTLLQQGDPTAMTTAATISVSGLMSGIITGTHSAGATQAYTLPTGTVLDAGVDMQIGEAFEVSIINLSAAAADTITLTAASGITIVGEPVIAASHSTTGELYGTSATFRIRKTAAETFVCYRV